MNRLQAGHPDEERLLRYSDSELSSREMEDVRAHLASCWQCRAGLEELHQVINDCVRYRKTVQDCFPSPPSPWCDIYQRFSEVDATSGRFSFFSGGKETLRSFLLAPRRWAPAIAALLVVTTVVYQFSNAPSVQAAQLLRNAVVASESRSVQPRRIRIKTGDRSVTRVIHAAHTAPASQEDAALQSMFVQAGYSWDDPLSAKAYAAWRDQLAGKQDRVTMINDPRSPHGNTYEIRTTTGAGELLEASLKLRVQDLRPIESALQFRNQERIEITELDEPALASIAPSSPNIPSSSHSSTPERVLPRAPESSFVSEELQVFAALRRLNADLGEPIEMKAAGSQLIVSALGIPADRRRQIEEQLCSIPGVQVQFSDPSAAVPQTEGNAPAPAAVPPEVAKLQSRLEKYLGGRATFEHMADRVLDMNERLLSRVHALRRLAERFPPAVEAGLSATGARTLRDLRAEHAQALMNSAIEMEQYLSPALHALGAPAVEAPPRAGGTWQAATEDMFRLARRTETLLAVILGGAASESVSGASPSQILSSLVQLRASAEAYRSDSAATH